MPTPEEVKAARLSIQKAYEELRINIQAATQLVAACPHWIEKTPWCLKGFIFPNGTVVNEDSDCPSASCSACGKNFGWWCPKSVDHLCDYDHPVGSERYPEGRYNEDDCRYCHDPEERK